MKTRARVVFALASFVFMMSGHMELLCAEETRPFFEYKGNYRENIDAQKKKFMEAYGYELMDLDVGWRLEEIALMDEAFSSLPSAFYGLAGLKGFYRTSYLPTAGANLPADEVPAATYPTFSTIHRKLENSYNVYVADDYLRIEFYNPLFLEDREDILNIIHHEMGHAYDLARGLVSFSAEWLDLARFRVINIPALDARKDSDFVYALVNDPAVPNYAPVASRHHPTYSRQNPQEDFANSVAAYIHYPYFRYSNPERYRYMRKNVFADKEYFSSPGKDIGYEEAVLADLDKALAAKNRDGVLKILSEAVRLYNPKLDAQTLARLKQAAGSKPAPAEALDLAVASCYLLVSDAVEFRRDLARNSGVELQALMKNRRCFQVGRDMFEQGLAPLAPLSIYYYREGGRDYIQFLDPVQPVAAARGFDSRYLWRLSYADESGMPVADGLADFPAGGGSVKIDLQKTAGKDFKMPFEKTLKLELLARRTHSGDFKTLESKSAQIQFVFQPWFEYIGPTPPKLKAIYPLPLLFLEKKE